MDALLFREPAGLMLPWFLVLRGTFKQMSRDQWFLASTNKDALSPHVLSCTLIVGYIVIREQLLSQVP